MRKDWPGKLRKASPVRTHKAWVGLKANSPKELAHGGLNVRKRKAYSNKDLSPNVVSLIDWHILSMWGTLTRYIHLQEKV